MPTTIKLRNSVTTTSAPSSLVQGEVAINITDKKVWVGNAATTPIQLLGDGGSGSFTSIAFGAGTVSSPSITFTGDTNTGIYSPAADTIAFTEGGVESMRIDSSGNVGIGTSSPSAKLDVDAGNPTVINAGGVTVTGQSSGIRFRTGSTKIAWYVGAQNNIDQAFEITPSTANGGTTFSTPAFVINSNGNVGIGTSSPYNKLETNVSGGATVGIANSSSGAGILYGKLAFYSTVAAGAYAEYGGQIRSYSGVGIDYGDLRFYTANGATTAERMRIDSSGNVGIGTSSPANRLDVQAAVSATPVTNGVIRIVTTGSNPATGRGGGLLFAQQDSGGSFVNYASITGSRVNNAFNNKVDLCFATGSPSDAIAITERMRITTDGYTKISTAGTYANGNYHEIINNRSGDLALMVRNTTTDPYGMRIEFSGATPNNTTNYFLLAEDTTNQKCAIYSSGTVTNRTGTYNAFSDIKLKQDVVDAGSQWNDIKNLRVRKFRLKDEVAADPNYPAYIGLIAQEVELVSPSLVDDCPDFEEVEIEDEEGNITKNRQFTGTVTKSVKYSILYMKAVKALQEAMERIETLEAKVAKFESK